jgi:tricorn protease
MASLRFHLSRLFLVACMVVPASVGVCGAQKSAEHVLLRNPSLSKDKIAFLYAADIWTVSRDGGDAERLTSGGSVTEGPYFSPDGKLLAYSTNEHGVTDVYVVSSEGGVPKRITWDPEGNYAAGWTPDGKDVVFASMHASYSDFFRLFKKRGASRPMERRWPMSRSCSGRMRGSTIAAVRRRRSGW